MKPKTIERWHRVIECRESSALDALRQAIHLKLLPSSPQAMPRTWSVPTMAVLISRAGPAATRGAGQPAP